VDNNCTALSKRLVKITGGRITQQQSRTIVRSKIAKVIKSILGQPFSPDFSRYLYFQKNNTNNHGLRWGVSANIKEHHKHHIGVYNVVTQEFQLALGPRGIYIANNLHITPHGDDDVNDMGVLVSATAANNVTFVVIASIFTTINYHRLVL